MHFPRRSLAHSLSFSISSFSTRSHSTRSIVAVLKGKGQRRDERRLQKRGRFERVFFSLSLSSVRSPPRQPRAILLNLLSLFFFNVFFLPFPRKTALSLCRRAACSLTNREIDPMSKLKRHKNRLRRQDGPRRQSRCRPLCYRLGCRCCCCPQQQRRSARRRRRLEAAGAPRRGETSDVVQGAHGKRR